MNPVSSHPRTCPSPPSTPPPLTSGRAYPVADARKTPSPRLAHGSAPGPACSRPPVVAHGVEPRRAGRTAEPVEDAPGGRRVGRVSKAEITSTTLKNAAVEACLIEEFGTMRFPKPEGGGTVTASYPFTFAPS